jgi:cytochrome oxidase Cu insertion factor (SCO1/SenC/PrrC family)
MNSILSPASPILVAAFRSALLQQCLIIAAVFALLLIAWALSRTAAFGATARKSAAAAAGAAGAAGAWPEPRARRLLRIGFGVIWLFDGILQAQPQMPGGLADQVIQPSGSSSPGWVQHLVNYGVNLWDYHPIQAATATVWIQVGIGLWLVIAVRGRSARLAGLAAVTWGLIVWVFGEAFGGIFAPGLTVLFGAPGAALLYVVAGTLLVLPERAWDTARLGRLLLAGMGAFFLGMAVLQAWPGRGFWQGRAGGQLGSLAAMIASMTATPQPHPVDAIVSGFGNFTIAHGFAVNLVTVIALGVIGAGLFIAAVRADARLAGIMAIAGAVFCLADWILIEDLGFLGGLGTDPNSMIPLILLFTGGYLGLTPARRPVPAPTGVPGLIGFAGAPLRVVAGVGAFAVVLAGAAPMALATTNPNADPITAQAISGTTGQFDTPAANFTLTSQDGRQVSLASLRGKVVLLTFLDPVCTTDCPIIAQEMRSADTLLGAKADRTELVAVVANPTYTSLAYTRTFTSQENLSLVPNWLFLTGSLSQLTAVWHDYGIEVEDLPAGAMAAHNDLAFVIGAGGMLRQELSDDPGPATRATTSSFAGLMADSVLQTMAQP